MVNYKISTKDLVLFIIYIWLFFVPFSHAPSYIHPLITFPGILSSLMILLTFLNPHNIKKIIGVGKYQIIYPILIVCILSYYWSFPVMSTWNDKFLNFYLAHIWLLLLLFSVYFNFNEIKINEDKAIAILFITLCISVIYSIPESFLPLLNIDIGSYIPRYDRQEYEAGYGLIFFRTRAFNYESGNLAMLFNTAFPILLYKFINSNLKYFIMTMWIISILLTYSSVHILFLTLFISFLFINIFIKKLIRFKIQKSHIFIILIFMLFLLLFRDLFDTIISEIAFKITSFVYGDTQETYASGMVRRYLFTIGYNALSDSSFWGHGYAGFYNYIDSGFNNFYLQLFVQLGLFAVLFILIILYFGYRVSLTKNAYYIFSFFAGWVHLFFIGDFWLPQLFLPIGFAELELRRRSYNFK